MKNIKILLLLLLLTMSAQINATTPEIWIRILDNDGHPESKTIEVFSSYYYGYKFFDSGVSSTSFPYNAYCDVGDDNTSNPTWDPLNFGTTYLIKIGGTYCKISTAGPYEQTPDLSLKYQYGNFTVISSHEAIILVDQGVWNQKLVNVNNSFNSGTLKVDGQTESSGFSDYFGEPTFPHRL